jgi:hypothetical protein
MITLKKIGEWQEICPSNYLCTLPFNSKELELKLHIQFELIEEDGLGLLNVAYIVVDGCELLMRCPYDGMKEHYVFIYIKGTENYPLVCLDTILDLLSTDKNELIEVNAELSEARWSLVRLDDNGNEFEIYRFMQKNHAIALQNFYENKKHKQQYFIHGLARSSPRLD